MTVAELIEKLKAFPPETEVLIADADTDWALDVNVSFEKYRSYNVPGQRQTVYLWGEYREDFVPEREPLH